MGDAPAALIALLLARLATERPEKFDAVIRISEGQDSLVIGNITGAMVVQGTRPATLGSLFTPWALGVSWGTIGFLTTCSAIRALLGWGVLLRTQFMCRNRTPPAPFRVPSCSSPSSSTAS